MFRRSRAYTTIIVKFFVLSIMFCVMCGEVKGLPSSTEECLDGICKNSMLTETPPDDHGSTKMMESSSSTLPLPSLGMISENVHSDVTDVPPAPVVPLHMDEKQKGRAINFTLGDSGTENIISPNGTIIPHTKATTGKTKPKMKDLSDVSMDDDDEDIDSVQFVMTTQRTQSVTMKELHCEHNEKKYKIGEKVEMGCDETCICEMNGKMNCKPRCTIPFFRKGRQVNDPLCTERDVEDPCCAILVCAADTATEPLEMCSYKNKTYARGENFDEGCLNRCKCEHSGNVVCKPRCAPVTNKTSDRCVTVPDPKDSCCKLVLCDVTLNEHEKDTMPMSASSDLAVKITSVNPINSTSIQLSIEAFSSNISLKNVEVSEDKQNWITKEILPENIISGLKSGSKYFVKIGSQSNIVDVQLPADLESKVDESPHHGACKFKDNSYKIGEEFHDGCVSYCLCTEQGVTCDKIDCPTNFGLDVLDPHCLEWETVPPHFVPTPPHCCAERMQCKNNGSCTYEDKMYANFAEIPINITGCHKRCYCEMGSVTCQDACLPVTAQPPSTLPCKPEEATLSHLPDDDCCLYWICKENNSTNGFIPGLPGNFPANPNFNSGQDEINITDLEALNEHTVRLVFTVPPVIVGLHGRVELRYTDQINNDNPATWELQVFAPPNDFIGTQQLEFELPGLLPDTEYKIKITVILRDLHNTPSSRIYRVRTLPPAHNPETTLPPIIPINPSLSVGEVNATWITVTWRKFTDYELQFIDGVQLRYKEINGMVYAATPLIHRAVTSYTIENLKANTEYEVGIYFIPFHGQQTELQSENMLRITTPLEIDLYGFNVTLETNLIKSTSVEISWSGVPYPEDKYVNIYRAIYQTDFGKEDFSTFKIAKRDSPTKTTIFDLKPSTNYRLWLEVYLTNGKIKTSNVKDFTTKDGVAPSLNHSTQQGKLAGVTGVEANKQEGDYYGPLVVVAIIAAVAIFASLVLTSMLMKRHGQNKAAITTPSTTRVSQACYNNPTYKVEIQQETMNL